MATVLILSSPYIGNLRGARAASSAHGAVAQVLAVESVRARAMVVGDLAVLNDITSNDYVHVESTGRVRTKAEFLDGFRRGEYAFESFVIDENRVDLYGDTAVVSGRYHTVIRTQQGTQPRKDARHLRVYVLRNGVWSNVAHQATETR